MVLKTNCKKCSEFFKYNGKYCNMQCKLKGVNKIYPKSFSMKDIKDCLENNIGIKVNESKICRYSREIQKIIK